MKNTKYTQTENGAIQFNTTGKSVLDLFASIGSCREMAKSHPDVLIKKFYEAFVEDPKKAIAILFWARSIRDGAGERNVFRVIVKWLLSDAKTGYSTIIQDNIEQIANLGYWKDLVFVYDNTDNLNLKNKIVSLWCKAIEEFNKLAMKWLPKNHELYRRVKDYFKVTNKAFRKIIKNADTVEQKMCAQKWEDIDVSKVPSQAFNNYKKTFFKHIGAEKVIADAMLNGLNTGAIYPHEITKIFRQYSSDDIVKIADIQWKNLKDFVDEEQKFITVCDMSGSMDWKVGNTTAMNIAIALSLYCSERLTGPFKNKIIAFNDEAAIITDNPNKSIFDRYKEIENYSSWGTTTNIISVFKTILKLALQAESPKDIPSSVLILSDMQFNSGVRYDTSLMDSIRSQYKKHGIKMPSVIYWNLVETNTGFHDSQYDNVAFASGFNPKLLKAIFEGSKYSTDANGEQTVKIDPVLVMNKALEPIEKVLDLSHVDFHFSQIEKDTQFNDTIGQSIRTSITSNIEDEIDNEEW